MDRGGLPPRSPEKVSDAILKNLPHLQGYIPGLKSLPKFYFHHAFSGEAIFKPIPFR
jgi:hypothetical protein